MLLQRKVSSGICNQTTIIRVIMFHEHKEEEHRLKILGKEKEPEVMEE